MEKAVGVFQHEKSEGMDEYLTTLGVPWMVRLVFYSLKKYEGKWYRDIQEGAY